MNEPLEHTFRYYPRPYLTEAELEVLLDGTPDSRYVKVKRLLAKEKLLHIRRGLYCLTDKVGYTKKPHPLELANIFMDPLILALNPP